MIRRSGPLRRTLTLTITVAFSVAVLPIYAVGIAPALGEPALAGTLVAAYGAGGLAGSALLMIRPLRADADKLTALLAGLVAVTLLIVIPMPSTPTTITAYAVAGIANSLFFAATLAGRSEFAPPEARGQVFIWVGALKIAAGAAGTAAAGALIGASLWLPVVAVAILTAATAGACALQRSRPPGNRRTSPLRRPVG